MNKYDLTAVVARKTGLTKKSSEAAINAVCDAICEELADGGIVRINGFGTFEVKNRKPRIGRNPKTKEPVNIEAAKAPVFRPGTIFKAAVNEE